MIMTKRVTAAFIAAIMCMGLAACGDVEEKPGPAAEGTAAATTTTTAVTTAEETSAAESTADNALKESADDATDTAGSSAGQFKSSVGDAAAVDTRESDEKNSSLADSSENDRKREVVVTDDAIMSDGMIMKLISDNMLGVFESDLEAEPTNEELISAADAVIAQYRAAEAKDLDAYLKTIRFNDLAEPTALMIMDSKKYEDGGLDEYLKKTGQSTKYEIIVDMADLAGDLFDEKTMDKLTEAVDSDKISADEMKALMKEAYAGITASSQTVKEGIDGEGVFDTEGIEPLEGVDSKSVYAIYVEYCDRDKDGGVYMSGELIIITAEKMYELGEVSLWNVNGKWGVFIDDDLYGSEVSDEEKGMTARELFEMYKKEITDELDESTGDSYAQ